MTSQVRGSLKDVHKSSQDVSSSRTSLRSSDSSKSSSLDNKSSLCKNKIVFHWKKKLQIAFIVLFSWTHGRIFIILSKTKSFCSTCVTEFKIHASFKTITTNFSTGTINFKTFLCVYINVLFLKKLIVFMTCDFFNWFCIFLL